MVLKNWRPAAQSEVVGAGASAGRPGQASEGGPLRRWSAFGWLASPEAKVGAPASRGKGGGATSGGAATSLVGRRREKWRWPAVSGADW